MVTVLYERLWVGARGRCPLPAGTPSCRGQRCCPSSAWRGPAGGGRDTLLPTAKGYSWALLSWQPFSTATSPLLHPVGGRKEGSEQPGFEDRTEERKEGKEGWRSSWAHGREERTQRSLWALQPPSPEQSKNPNASCSYCTWNYLCSPHTPHSQRKLKCVCGFCALLVIVQLKMGLASSWQH